MFFLYRKISTIAICVGVVMTLPAYGAQPSPLSGTWLSHQINQHPDIIAANELLKAVFSSAQGAKKPLYNPQLASGVEREGNVTNFSIGLIQTIDIWDKQQVKAAQANYQLTAASKGFTYRVEEKTAQALQALIKWQAVNEKAALALAQEQQLKILLDIVRDRKNVGDIAQIDLELTFLNLSQLLNRSAKIQSQLRQTKAQVMELLPDWTPSNPAYPKQGLGITNVEVPADWIKQHPLVAQAGALWQVQKSQADYAILRGKAEPTVGFTLGKNNSENVVAMTFSMPLNVRNNYSDDVTAAQKQALSAQASFHSAFRKQKYLVQANTDSLISTRGYLQRWQKLMAGRGDRSAQLLNKQWRAGDINTSKYLLALQQRTDGLYAGIELQAQFNLSEVNWLLSVGQIRAATNRLNPSFRKSS